MRSRRAILAIPISSKPGFNWVAAKEITIKLQKYGYIVIIWFPYHSMFQQVTEQQTS